MRSKIPKDHWESFIFEHHYQSYLALSFRTEIMGEIEKKNIILYYIILW